MRRSAFLDLDAPHRPASVSRQVVFCEVIPQPARLFRFDRRPGHGERDTVGFQTRNGFMSQKEIAHPFSGVARPALYGSPFPAAFSPSTMTAQADDAHTARESFY